MSEMTPEAHIELAEQAGMARSEFIEANYDKLFGTEEMGDPEATFRPEDLTTVLAAYERHLATKGLLRVRKEQ